LVHSVSLLQVMLDYVGEIVTREFTPTVIMEKFENMVNKVYHSPESFLVQLVLHRTYLWDAPTKACFIRSLF